MFELSLAWHRDTCDMIIEFLIHLPVCEKGRFMACWDVEYYVGYLSEQNNCVFRGLERDPRDVWPLVRFYVSLQTSISRVFCN